MSLFSDDDILSKEIESQKGFVDSLRKRPLLSRMLNDCYRYSEAIRAKRANFHVETTVLHDNTARALSKRCIYYTHPQAGSLTMNGRPATTFLVGAVWALLGRGAAHAFGRQTATIGAPYFHTPRYAATLFNLPTGDSAKMIGILFD